jgi:hypothetical protein
MRRPWRETKAVLQKVVEISEDRDIAQALEIIAGLEGMLTAYRTGDHSKADSALTRLERAGYHSCTSR